MSNETVFLEQVSDVLSCKKCGERFVLLNVYDPPATGPYCLYASNIVPTFCPFCGNKFKQGG